MESETDDLKGILSDLKEVVQSLKKALAGADRYKPKFYICERLGHIARKDREPQKGQGLHHYRVTVNAQASVRQKELAQGAWTDSHTRGPNNIHLNNTTAKR